MERGVFHVPSCELSTRTPSLENALWYLFEAYVVSEASIYRGSLVIANRLMNSQNLKGGCLWIF